MYAPDATTSDAIATMLSVVEPVEGLAFVEALMNQGTPPPATVGCLVVDAQGQQFSNHVWDALIVKE